MKQDKNVHGRHLKCRISLIMKISIDISEEMPETQWRPCNSGA
jgi:hypothetical protein